MPKVKELKSDNDESGDEIEIEDSDIEIDFVEEKAVRTKELTITKLTQHEQILLRPSTQLGSV